MDQPIFCAQRQLDGRSEEFLHSASAGALVWRKAQLASGDSAAARRAIREQADHINAKHSDLATVFVYEDTFGTRDRIHWLLHLNSLADYPALVRMGPGGAPDGPSNGVLGRAQARNWPELFLPGSVSETVLLPHRWGMFGTATEAMAQDPSVSPVVPEGAQMRFEVEPAQAQTSLPDELTVHSGNAGVIMHRAAEATYEFRAEARVFARTVAENNNLSMNGHSSVFLYEEAFGHMDRLHMLIHMRSLDTFYLMMGLDARTDADAPRASYIQDWISMDKGGGAWDRIMVQGSTHDTLLTPADWSAL
ncbi:DUF6039 family protein [Streptomyces sp. NPDC048441]|uniref:DUF6039 family protein n=1 Tax=Streptomyces sp. NPDC048441 TaxID=3365552 RepID=UPI00371D7842